jgi:hypothetical protein
MAVIQEIDGGFKPICNSCGIALCYSLSEEEYYRVKAFWDKWECDQCNPNAVGALTKYLASAAPERQG